MSDAVARRVRTAILGGELAAGARIRQAELAERMGTSRIPVREALRRLESEGLVRLVPHSGARVAVMDFDEYSELYRIREAVEPMAIAESAKRLDDAQLDRLAQLVAAIERSKGDPPRWLDYDRRFHLGSYAAASMPRVLKLIERFWNQTQQYRRAYFYEVKRDLDVVDSEHALILDALRRRDPVDAERLQRCHIRRTRKTLDRHIELFA